MWWNHWRRGAGWLAAVVAGCGIGTLALGGYLGGSARTFTPVVPGPAPAARPGMAAVFWSGDMGTWVGFGSDLPERLASKGIPVLTINTPALFGRARDAAFARAEVARSLADAIRRSGARQVAVIGFSFGADVLAATLGQLDPALRQRIGPVVLVGPATGIYFHANPFGLFYRGPSVADPRAAAASLRGLKLSCIFAAAEADESLCREPALRRSRLTQIDDGHMMLFHREDVTRAVIASVLNPPEPLQ